MEKVAFLIFLDCDFLPRLNGKSDQCSALFLVECVHKDYTSFVYTENRNDEEQRGGDRKVVAALYPNDDSDMCVDPCSGPAGWTVLFLCESECDQ